MQTIARTSRRSLLRSSAVGALSATALLTTACTQGLANAGSPTVANQPTPTPGSAQPPSPVSTHSGQVRLTFMAWGDFTEQKVMKQAIVDFRRKHPGVTVDYINTTGAQHYVKLDTMIAGGDAPAVFYVDPSLMPAYVKKGAFAALDSLVASSKFDLSDFFPKALGQYDWRGKLYGIPRGFGNQDLYWNQSRFRQKGLPSPGLRWDDPDWTTDRFLELAEKLTIRQGDRVVQYGYSQGLGLRQWEPWVWLFGGEVTDDANEKCLLDQEPAVAGLQFLSDLMHRYQVMPTPAFSQQENNTNLFSTGRLAMNMDIPAALTAYRKLKTLSWDVAPMPKKVKAVTSGGGIAWAIYAKAPLDDAWNLLAWLAGPEVQKAECAAGTVAPPRRSVATSECYVNPSLPPEHMQVFVDAPNYVHLDPQAVHWPEIQTLIDKEFGYIWDGTKPVRAVVTELVPKVNALLAEP